VHRLLIRLLRSYYINKYFYFRKELREIKDSGETKILLDCSFGILSEVLLQAQQVGLMGSEHNFIIASLVSTMDTWTNNFNNIIMYRSLRVIYVWWMGVDRIWFRTCTPWTWMRSSTVAPTSLAWGWWGHSTPNSKTPCRSGPTI